MDEKQITYHIGKGDPAPIAGRYMVFVGKRGILSVWLIKDVRAINPRVVCDCDKYRMTLSPRPDLKEFTVLERYRSFGEDCAAVWVRGEEAYPSFWMPRSTKKSQ